MAVTMHNSDNDVRVTIRYDFECFDRLPKTVRAALASANNKYCSVQLYELWASKAMTARELIAELREFEQIQARKVKRS